MKVKNEYDASAFGGIHLKHWEKWRYGHSQKVISGENRSKEAVEESLMEYNPIHLNIIDFDYLHLVNEINPLFYITDEFTYILGSLM